MTMMIARQTTPMILIFKTRFESCRWKDRAEDRGREVRFAGLPSLQTVRAVFPHTAFQSVVACDGLIETKVGFAQTIQARFRKEVIRPAVSTR